MMKNKSLLVWLSKVGAGVMFGWFVSSQTVSEFSDSWFLSGMALPFNKPGRDLVVTPRISPQRVRMSDQDYSRATTASAIPGYLGRVPPRDQKRAFVEMAEAAFEDPVEFKAIQKTVSGGIRWSYLKARDSGLSAIDAELAVQDAFQGTKSQFAFAVGIGEYEIPLEHRKPVYPTQLDLKKQLRTERKEKQRQNVLKSWSDGRVQMAIDRLCEANEPFVDPNAAAYEMKGAELDFQDSNFLVQKAFAEKIFDLPEEG